MPRSARASMRALFARETSPPAATTDGADGADGAHDGVREPGFFDGFPVFLDTSETSAYPWRLNLRHEAIFGRGVDVTGRSVLDIASHDGRWSFAALTAGAAHVTGIEARPELVDHAEATFADLGVGADRFAFERGDVFAVLGGQEHAVDVVLCLGFYYHTLRHNELFALMARTGAERIVIDTEVLPRPEPFIRVTHEWVDRQGNAVADRDTSGEIVMTGRPTVAAMAQIAWGHGFELETVVDWTALLAEHPGAAQISDYRDGRRATVVLRRTDGPAPTSPRQA